MFGLVLKIAKQVLELQFWRVLKTLDFGDLDYLRHFENFNYWDLDFQKLRDDFNFSNTLS